SREFESEGFAFPGHEEQAVAAIVSAFFLRDVSLINQLFEHSTQRLLCDVENLKQVGNLYSRIAVDEMKHAMVRATEAQLEEHFVRIADEIAVGKKQQLDDVPNGFGWAAGPARPLRHAVLGRCCLGTQIYVSHVDIFWIYVTKTVSQTKGYYRSGPFSVDGELEGPDRSVSALFIPGIALRRKVLAST